MGRGLAVRIALAALAAAGFGMAILAAGVLVVGAETFEALMLEAGSTADHAQEMYDASVTRVVVGASAVAVAAAVVLALVLGRMLARPLDALAVAAGRVARGDYAARVPRSGPDEVAALADSFNQMAAALEDQERLRREFIANAAHELRTPLTNLQGYLEALRDGIITADPATYESLWEEADRLVRLSRGLDALAAGDAATGPPAIEPVDVTEHVRAAIALAAPAVERAGLSITSDLPPAVRARANPDHLKQVLDNVLSNAIRYTPPGGSISVTAERRREHVLIAISNTATIPDEDVPHLFERFYRVEKSRDRAQGGAGIGLAIVKQLVEAGGGRVTASSAGGITRLSITLPGAAAGL